MQSTTPKPQKDIKESSKNVPKKPQFKIIIRRLPLGFTQDELLNQIEPLEDCPTLWFRKANKLMESASFTRAYLAFEDWTKAVEFKQKFNGYVFVDKQGNESAAIVELAVHQDVPTNFAAASAKNDKRVGTLEERPEYKEFLEEFNNLDLHKVTNFDELIRKVEEKEKRQEKGMVCETPLVKFIDQQAFEKEKKRFARLEKHKPKNDRSKVEKPKTDKSQVEKPKNDKPLPDKSKAEKLKTDRPRNDRPKADKPKVEKPKDDKPKVENPKDDKPKVEGSSRRRNRGRNEARTEDHPEKKSTIKLLTRNKNQGDVTDGQSLDKQLELSSSPRISNSSNGEINGKSNLNDSTNDKSEDSENVKVTDEKRRRNTRPEREIYRPPVRNRDNKKEKTPNKDPET